MEEVNIKKKQKLDNLYNKYKPHEKFLIAKQARKTIRYIERNTMSFPNTYKVLKTRIIESSYSILENIYRANIFQEVDYKKEVVVNIQMLNFYLEEALRKDLISNKKFESYSNNLLELDLMVRSWFKYEKSI